MSKEYKNKLMIIFKGIDVSEGIRFIKDVPNREKPTGKETQKRKLVIRGAHLPSSIGGIAMCIRVFLCTAA